MAGMDEHPQTLENNDNPLPVTLDSEPLASFSQAPPRQPAPREIWKLLDFILLLGFIPVALFGSHFALLVAYSALRPVAGWQAPVEQVQSGTIFLLVQQCFFYVFILTFLFILARVEHQQPFWRSLGWKPLRLNGILTGLAGGFGLALLASLCLWLLPDNQSFPLEKLFTSRAASIAICAFAVLIAPVVEELVFRGLLFAISERLAGLNTAVIVTALLFAGLHAPEYWHAWNHLLIITMVGFVFSFVRAFTDNLAPSTVLHIGYNFLIVLGVFFSTKHFQTFSAIIK